MIFSLIFTKIKLQILMVKPSSSRCIQNGFYFLYTCKASFDKLIIRTNKRNKNLFEDWGYVLCVINIRIWFCVVEIKQFKIWRK